MRRAIKIPFMTREGEGARMRKERRKGDENGKWEKKGGKERERAHLIDIPTELLLYHQFPLFPDRVLSYIFQCWKVIGL